MRRRTLIASIPVPLAGVTSGCLGVEGLSIGSPEGSSDENEPPESCLEADEELLQCGEAPPITETIDLDQDDDVRYEGDGNIAYRAIVRPGEGNDDWETESFERFADRTCASRLPSALLTHVRSELENDTGLGAGWGHVEGIEGTQVFVTVAVGEPSPEDPVQTDAVVEVTPMYVESTVRIEEQELVCEVPVFVREQEPPTPD